MILSQLAKYLIKVRNEASLTEHRDPNATLQASIHSFDHSRIHSLRRSKKQLYYLVFLLLLLSACEERFQPDLSNTPSQLVIEGHIEVAENPLPPYVILTRTVPFFSTISANTIEKLFVHNALVQVSDGVQTISLEEVCWENLPDELRTLVIETLPEIEDININYCVYTDLSFSFLGEVGKTYSLYVETGEEVATANTTISTHAPLDSIYFVTAPGGFGDSLLEMRVKLSDPLLSQEYYRYFTSTNNGLFYAGFNSVFNDKLFEGQTVEFPLSKGEPRFREDDAEVFGLFYPGDEVTLRWTNIDEPHYDFWNTLEFNKVNQGPFGSYTQIQSNIEGGLGIWGGYAASHYRVVAER